MNMLLLPVI